LRRNPAGYDLMPAYDMVATILVNSADKEEFALTLNGKKRKIRKEDFQKAFALNGLDEKSIESIFTKFSKSIPDWIKFIQLSFIPETMKSAYIELIVERANRLGIE